MSDELDGAWRHLEASLLTRGLSAWYSLGLLTTRWPVSKSEHAKTVGVHGIFIYP